MEKLVISAFNLYSFISLLFFSVGIELDSQKEKICKIEVVSFSDAPLKLRSLGHEVIPFILCHYFSNRRSELEDIGEIVSSPQVPEGVYWNFYENKVISMCFGEDCLPYSIDLFCSVVSTSSFDIGKLHSLSLMVVPFLDATLSFNEPHKDLLKAQKEFRREVSKAIPCSSKVKPMRMSLKAVKYISEMLEIPMLKLKTLFGIQ
jgi:hypothetical protein